MYWSGELTVDALTRVLFDTKHRSDVGWNTTRRCQKFSVLHLQVSLCTKEYYERIVDMFESVRMTQYPVISSGDLNFDYVLNETLSTNSIYYIDTAYDQPTRFRDKTSSILDVILTSHPELHRESAVLNYTMSDHFLIYTHIEFEDTKSLTVDHDTVRFRDMKKFVTEIFAHDLIESVKATSM